MSLVKCHMCALELPSSKAFSVDEKSFCTLAHLREYKASLPPPKEEVSEKRFINHQWGGCGAH